VDPKDFIKKQVESGVTQTEIANRVGVSNATVYKMLYTNTTLTLATIRKIAKAYGKPLSFFLQDSVAEEAPYWEAATDALPEEEQRLLAAFRQLDDRRQTRAIETIEDMALAGRESNEREGPANDSADLNLKRNSNG